MTVVRLLLLLLAPTLVQAAPVSVAALRPAMEEAVRRALPDSVQEVEVVTLSVRGTLEAPAQATFRIRARGDEDWLGSVAAEVDVYAEGALLGSVSVVAEVIAWVTVPVLRQGVSRGERITQDRVATARRQLDGLPPGVLLDAPRIVGRVAKRDLGLNQLVKEADLEIAVAAARNSMVTILVHRGGLRLISSGVLREDAQIGETVAVWNEGTKVEQRGVLVAPDTVMLPTLGPVAQGGL